MDRVDQYREYRREGQELNSKLVDTLNDGELMEAGRFLGMTVEEGDDEVLYHEGELDMAIQSDFAIHELAIDGKTALERYHEAEKWDTEADYRDHLISVHRKVMTETESRPESVRLFMFSIECIKNTDPPLS